MLARACTVWAALHQPWFEVLSACLAAHRRAVRGPPGQCAPVIADAQQRALVCGRVSRGAACVWVGCVWWLALRREIEVGLPQTTSSICLPRHVLRRRLYAVHDVRGARMRCPRGRLERQSATRLPCAVDRRPIVGDMWAFMVIVRLLPGVTCTCDL